MKEIVFSLAVALVSIGTVSSASCLAKAPSHKWNLHSDDQRLTGDYLNKTLTGKKVKYDGGTEHYRSKGRYRYQAGSDTYDAPSYHFYDNGIRCIGYSQARYDMYVVNNGKLVLINWHGGRYEGKLR